MIHGGVLTGKQWEATPDGRTGWRDFFTKRQHPVYGIEQVSRGRSGFDLTKINEVKAGSALVSELPNIFSISREDAWTNFRFGPQFPVPFPGEQFPLEAVGEFFKQAVPDFNSSLPTPIPTLLNLSALATRLNGAVLLGHSESGAFPLQTAMINPQGISGMIVIEPAGCPGLIQDIATFAKIPTLVLFGDFISLFPTMWVPRLQGCQQFVQVVKAAGGDIQLRFTSA